MTARILHWPRPRTFTVGEAVIDTMREQIFHCGIPYRILAKNCGVSSATIQNIASGKTKWPRPTTLFPLLDVLNLQLIIRQKP